MDAGLVAFLFIGGTLVFAIMAAAKDSTGRRYGWKRMAGLWLASLPYFLSSAFEFTVKDTQGNPEKVKITYSLWFLLLLPFWMIASNASRRKRN